MPADPNAPYISVVVAARNDNHGGDMNTRMQAFLDSWIGQAQRYGLPSEIVVVEWNPPAGRGPLKDEFRWPRSLAPCSVRFIEVSRELHAAIPNAQAIPFHQMIAKNAGVRRARGQFVLCTNLDIIFSAELMQFLAGRTLDPKAMYRMDRYDIDKDVPANVPVDDLLAFCRTHVNRVSAREGTFATNGDNLRPVEPDDIVAPDSGLKLGRGWHDLEKYKDSPMLRYVESRCELAFERPAGSRPNILIDAEIGPSANEGGIDLDLLDPNGMQLDSARIDGHCQVKLTVPGDLAPGRARFRLRNGGLAMLQDVRMLDLRVFGIRWENGASSQSAAAPAASGWKLDVVKRAPGLDRTGNCPCRSPHAAHMRNALYLHTNACGDFTMLAREAWLALRGYPEFPTWPTHLDAVLCYAAHHAGFREVMLEDPMRIFHIQHEAIWTPVTEAQREERAASRGIPLIGYMTLMGQFHHMRRFNVPVIFSGADWGLGDAELPESTS